MSIRQQPPDHQVIQRYIQNRISDIEKHELHKESSGRTACLLEIIDALKEDVTLPLSDEVPGTDITPLRLRELDEILVDLYGGSMSSSDRVKILQNLFHSPITLDKLWIKSSQLTMMQDAESSPQFDQITGKSFTYYLQSNWMKAAIVLLFITAGFPILNQLVSSDGPPSPYVFAEKLPHPINDDTILGSTPSQTLFDQLNKTYKEGLRAYKRFNYAKADETFSKMVNNIPTLATSHSNPLNKHLYRNYYFYLAMSKMAHSQKFKYRSQDAINVLQAALEQLEKAETYAHQDVGELIDREIYYQGMILFFMKRTEEAKDKLSRIDSASPYFQRKNILLRNFRE